VRVSSVGALSANPRSAPTWETTCIRRGAPDDVGSCIAGPPRRPKARIGHLFTVTNTNTVYQYTIATGTWTAMPTGGPTGANNSYCGVGADGFLYVADPNESNSIYRIQLN
jgi:hypothetical protein